MNKINLKEKCWGKNTLNKRKRHKNLLKKKLRDMKEKLLMTLEKRKGIRNDGTCRHIERKEEA